MAKKVLIIEDHKETAEMMSSILSAEGLQTSWAENGQIGVEKTFAEKPDLILLDIMMPVMSGFEVYQKLKSNNDTKHIPIIIVSVKVSDKSIKEREDIGVEDYLPKPFDPIELIKTVKKHLGA
jgi:DNA-binding response OmpR family regulator